MMRIRSTSLWAAIVAVVLVAAVLLGRGPDPQPAGTSDTGREVEATPSSRPSPFPDRIILTWKGDPTTSQAVTWRTDTSVKNAVAQLAEATDGPSFDPKWSRKKDAPQRVVTVPAVTEELPTPPYSSHYHSVHFTGLRPSTKYVYRVGNEQHWSEWFQFETANTAPEPFGFLYFGDAQNGIRSHWSRVVRGAYSDMPKAKFIIHAGDLVDRGNNDGEWGEWHTAAGWINGMVPVVPTPGNHEYTGQKGLTQHWQPQFTLPDHGPPGLDETCYFFDYQGVRIVSLNSNEKIAEQVPWLENVLSSRPKSIRWTILTFHHPIYSTAAGRDNKALREAWRPVFDRHGVDLVLQGHDHTYGRSGLMRDDNLLSGNRTLHEHGTVYAVSVSGAKMYGVGRESWMESSAQDSQLYQLIRIEGDTLRYESRTARGVLYDSFVLRKRPSGGNELVSGDIVRTAHEQTSGSVVAAVVIVVAVLLGIGWALKRR